MHVSITALSDKVPNVSQTVTNYASAVKLPPMAEQNNLLMVNMQKQGQKIQHVLDEWQEVQKKCKNNWKRNVIYGNKTENESCLKAALTQRIWRMYVGNIKSGTSEEQVTLIVKMQAFRF